MGRAGRCITTCAVVAASGFNEATEFGYLTSQSIDLVSDDEYQRVMRVDSVDDGMRCGYADGSAVLFCDQDGSVQPYTVAPLLPETQQPIVSHRRDRCCSLKRIS